MGKRLVYGVGVNDADYQVTVYGEVDGKRTCTWECPVYRLWKSMITRCYSEVYLKKRPTYRGCKVSQEWLVFSNFLRWYKDYYIEGYHLDKDLLIEGNKLYSKETCIFIPREVNGFVAIAFLSREDSLTGVYFDKNAGNYLVRSADVLTHQQVRLGRYEDPFTAHKVWQNYKLKQALILQSKQSEKVAKAMQRFIDKLQNDIDNNLVTRSL